MKYPFDIISSHAKVKDPKTNKLVKKTLSVEARFVEREDEDDSPLKIFKDGLSRFVLTILIDGKAATCNIPLEKLEEMKSLTQYAVKKYYDSKYTSLAADSSNTSPAFTVRFVAGTLKGKSPADVLLENKDNPEKGRNILNDQYKWLKENLTKYPNNKELMDAIVDASKLDLNELSESSMTSTTSIIPILDLTCRPLIRKKQENGMCPCYECKITWDCSRNYPITIQVKNYLAPVTQKEDKTINVQISGKDKDSEIDNTFNMGADEWLNALKEMDDVKSIYKMLRMNGALKRAEAADAENRRVARENASSGN